MWIVWAHYAVDDYVNNNSFRDAEDDFVKIWSNSDKNCHKQKHFYSASA